MIRKKKWAVGLLPVAALLFWSPGTVNAQAEPDQRQIPAPEETDILVRPQDAPRVPGDQVPAVDQEIPSLDRVDQQEVDLDRATEQPVKQTEKTKQAAKDRQARQAEELEVRDRGSADFTTGSGYDYPGRQEYLGPSDLVNEFWFAGSQERAARERAYEDEFVGARMGGARDAERADFRDIHVALDYDLDRQFDDYMYVDALTLDTAMKESNIAMQDRMQDDEIVVREGEESDFIGIALDANDDGKFSSYQLVDRSAFEEVQVSTRSPRYQRGEPVFEGGLEHDLERFLIGLRALEQDAYVGPQDTEIVRERARDDQMPAASRTQDQAQMKEYRGTLRDFREVQLEEQDEPHLIAVIEAEDGTIYFADLGYASGLIDIDLQRDTEITVWGTERTIQDNRLLISERLMIGDEEYTLQDHTLDDSGFIEEEKFPVRERARERERIHR